MKKNLKAILGIVLASCMIMTACGNKPADGGSSSTGGEASGSGAAKVKDTVIIAAATEPKTLDAQGANDTGTSLYKNQIYDTLLSQDNDMNVIPSIAEKWEYTDDTTLKLTIRSGIKFHNGEDMTASDVLFSIKRAAESEFTEWMVDVVDVAASTSPDDTTVIVKLKQPSGVLLSQFCFLYVVDEKTVTEMGAEKFNETPIGSGPFVYKTWVRGDRVEFERNDNYWGKKPAYSKLIVRVIGEQSNRAIEVESGGVDIALKIGSSDIALLESNPNAQVVKKMDFGNYFVGFDCSLAPFTDKRVRQAISYAVDKEAIVKAVYGETGTVATGPISSAIWGYEPNLKQYEYNPEKAKQLLTEAGFPNGFDLIISTSDSQQRMDIAEIMQNQLGQVGIKTEVETLENSTYLDKIINGGFQMYILGWTTTTGDADYGLYETFHSGGPTWSNTARYSNAEIDKLLEAGRKSTNPDERMKIYSDVQKLIVEEAPWIFLCNNQEVAAIGKNVKGFEISPSGRYDMTGVTVEA